MADKQQKEVVPPAEELEEIARKNCMHWLSTLQSQNVRYAESERPLWVISRHNGPFASCPLYPG